LSGAVSVEARPLGGQRLFVVDGLFKPDFVRVLHEILSRQSFSLSDYDTEATERIRHWKAEFAPDFFATNPLLRTWHESVVTKAVELFSGTPLKLERVHANSHLFGDHQHPHHDIVPGVTALYFANPDWEKDWQGETIFYDAAGEPRHALAPLPGRLAVFEGGILHRGGVPARTSFGARYSVAFKFAAS
jgi:Rps23 Pro-64 3,4-dihydroxylase Tpa1-like proline 4-hydroxylase